MNYKIILFQKWMEDQAQKLVDQTARAFATNRVSCFKIQLLQQQIYNPVVI